MTKSLYIVLFIVLCACDYVGKVKFFQSDFGIELGSPIGLCGTLRGVMAKVLIYYTVVSKFEIQSLYYRLIPLRKV